VGIIKLPATPHHTCIFFIKLIACKNSFLFRVNFYSPRCISVDNLVIGAPKYCM
jgi:hypothetical protein